MEWRAFTHDYRSKPQRGGVFQPRAIALGNGHHLVQSPERAEYKVIELGQRGKVRGFGCQSSLRGDKPRGGGPRRYL
jgi:hypothetical protein